jgi:hypothetical protein
MDIFRILIFFPSISFSLLSVEIFPWAVIYYIVRKIKSYRKIKINKRVLPLIIGLLASLSYSCYMIFATDCDSDIFRSVIAYLNPILVYIAILYCSKKELFALCKMTEKILFFLVAIGILQTLGIINFLEPVFKYLVPRASTYSLELGGRGSTLFSSEPSRASYEILFIYITWRYLQQMPAIKQLLCDFFITFFILFVIKSSMGSFVCFIFLFSEYRLKFILSGLVVAIIGLPLLINSNSRAIQVIINIFSHSSISEIFGYVLSVSGFRLISIIAAYKYGILHPFGGGIGLWQTTSVEALYETNIPPFDLYYFRVRGGFVPVRPTSFLSSMVLDMGWIAIIIIFYLIKPLFKLISFDNKLFSLIITFLFYLIAVGAIGNPIPWICTAICYKVYNARIENRFYKAD